MMEDKEIQRLIDERNRLRVQMDSAARRVKALNKNIAEALNPYPIGTIMTRMIRWGYRNQLRTERARIVQVSSGGWTETRIDNEYVTLYGVRIRKDGKDGKKIELRSRNWKPEDNIEKGE